MATSAINRISFGSQKLIYILLHCKGLTTSGIHLIHESLQEVLSIAAALSGASRIPGIGIGLLKIPFEEVMPLTPVRGCIDTVIQRLQMLKYLQTTDDNADIDSILKFVFSIIANAASEFASTTAEKMKVFQIIEPFSLESKSLGAKKITVPENSSSGLHIKGSLLRADPYATRLVFKEFLFEESGKHPHMRLTFESNAAKTDFFFDLRESAIDVLILPSVIASKISLPLTGVRVSTTTTGKFIPVIEMECIQRFNFSSLSANWISGTMTYLLPSSAEQFNFQEFWDNSQRVYSLNDRLRKTNEALLCRMRSRQGGSSMQSHFVIFSFNQGLALAQVVSPELILNEVFEYNVLDIPKKFKDHIDEIMNEMELSDFRIENLQSNVVPTIINHLSRKPAKGLVKAVPACSTRRIHPIEQNSFSSSRRDNKQIHPFGKNVMASSYRTE